MQTQTLGMGSKSIEEKWREDGAIGHSNPARSRSPENEKGCERNERGRADLVMTVYNLDSVSRPQNHLFLESAELKLKLGVNVQVPTLQEHVGQS